MLTRRGTLTPHSVTVRRFFSWGLQTLGRDEAEVKAEHQEEKEHDGEGDAHGKRFYGTVGLASVLDKVIQRGAEAIEDDGDEQEDDDSDYHAVYSGKKFSLDDSSLRCQPRCFMVLNSNPGCGPASQPA